VQISAIIIYLYQHVKSASFGLVCSVAVTRAKEENIKSHLFIGSTAAQNNLQSKHEKKGKTKRKS